MKLLRNVLFALLLALLLIFQFGCELPRTPPATASNQLQAYFLDVGQADAAIIRYGKSTLLIDAGTNAGAKNLTATINNLGISRFDVVIGTHPHEDHIGGLDAVISQFDIGQVYLPKATATTNTFMDVLQAIQSKGLKISNPVPGSSFNIGEAQCTILAPNSDSYEDLNDYSIVIRVAYGDTSFLFTGDAESVSEKEMLSKGYTLESDVLKVAHHGSQSSTTRQFLEAVSPEYAVIPVGEGNDYGHPSQETLDKLTGAGIKIYRTDLSGTITFTSDGSNLTVSTGR